MGSATPEWVKQARPCLISIDHSAFQPFPSEWFDFGPEQNKEWGKQRKTIESALPRVQYPEIGLGQESFLLSTEVCYALISHHAIPSRVTWNEILLLQSSHSHVATLLTTISCIYSSNNSATSTSSPPSNPHSASG